MVALFPKATGEWHDLARGDVSSDAKAHTDPRQGWFPSSDLFLEWRKNFGGGDLPDSIRRANSFIFPSGVTALHTRRRPVLESVLPR